MRVGQGVEPPPPRLSFDDSTNTNANTRNTNANTNNINNSSNINNTTTANNDNLPPPHLLGLTTAFGSGGFWDANGLYMNPNTNNNFKPNSPPKSPENREGTGFAANTNNRKYDEQYYSYLNKQDANFAFKLFSPSRIYVFRAETAVMRDAFCGAIWDWVTKTFDALVLEKKVHALQELNPLLREQFVLQINQYNALVKALSKSGFMEDSLPITSTRKEKSGVLSMEEEDLLDFPGDGSSRWRDYYFVLFQVL
jgi:hypothetical protein